MPESSSFDISIKHSEEFSLSPFNTDSRDCGFTPSGTVTESDPRKNVKSNKKMIFKDKKSRPPEVKKKYNRNDPEISYKIE